MNYNESLWLCDKSKESYPALDRDLECDVLIIGGGLCGLSAAYYLRKQIRSLAVIEADTFGGGASGRNTGKLTSQHGCIYHKLIKKHGSEKARAYYDAQEEAIRSVQAIIEEHHIQCGFHEKEAVVGCLSVEKTAEVTAEMNALDQLSIPYEVVHEGELMHLKLGIRFKHQAAYDPYRYCQGLVQELAKCDVALYEQTPVTTIQDHQVLANNHTITYKQLIIATQFPIYDPMYRFASCMIPIQSVLAASTIEEDHSMEILTIDSPMLTGRTQPVGEQIMRIHGGFDHHSGVDHEKALRDCEFFHTSTTTKTPLCLWSSQDYVSTDYLPLMGELAKDIYFASGFGLWGNTNANVAGKLLAAYVLHEPSVYRELFEPHRISLFFNTRFIKEMLLVGNEFVQSKLQPITQTMPKQGEAEVYEHHAHPYGVYRSEHDDFYIVDLICPHLGCTLHFNQAEKTWDCPCHGSRFNYDGTIVKGIVSEPLKC